MKKFTLLAIIGITIIILQQIFYLLLSAGIISYETIGNYALPSNITGLVAWLLIGLFFVKLYKNQK